MSTLLNWLLIAIGIGGMFLILIAPPRSRPFPGREAVQGACDRVLGRRRPQAGFVHPRRHPVCAQGVPDPRLRADGGDGGRRLRRAQRVPFEASAAEDRDTRRRSGRQLPDRDPADHRLRDDAAQRRPGQDPEGACGQACRGGRPPGRRQRPHRQRQAGHRAGIHLEGGERPPGAAAGADGSPPRRQALSPSR